MRTKRFEQESKAFGIKLKHLRVRADLSIEDVAKAVQIAPTTYREWENGRAITGLPYKTLARAFGVTVAHLFDEGGRLKSVDIMEAVSDIDEAVKRIKALL